MRTVPLDEYATGVAAADGTCVVAIGPVRNQIWRVTNEAVTCASPLPSPGAPIANMYAGRSPNAGSQLSNTYDGVGDSASVAVTLLRNQVITVAWEGCDPGSLCTISVYGEMQVP